ncbi:SDR family oxidoreductase [Paenibacillus radicis (ex Gao et al. 2016)]|uniref:Short-chain dehydrogenase n=1 Tax=Paenibacillus radicis (ex Gao et al. 2016) TaxID=1737354 RepID=A0A917HAG0_9BACL|nr:SDR family oxidoreductase [Paenibacillus radicis (ex Gao et al. 2016)]GGG72927.1 short-chain dehydrogenase [Paenibacillus radicis (ex Gao et al. 2016)]
MSNFSLNQKRIVIIGGSSGIGFATAQQAVEQGAYVILAGRSQQKLEKAQELLGGANHAEIHTLNNQNEEELQAFFAKIGNFDHLFTPGASYVRGSIASPAEVAHSCFNAKFWPQYNAVKYAAPFLSKDGSIVLMSGAFGQRPLADGASYAACNGAIESLGKALAVELSPIRVNVISPGTIHTAFNWEGAAQEVRDESYRQYAKMNLVGRVGTAEEAAHTTLYLMTNGYTTGSTLFPDGGYIMR